MASILCKESQTCRGCLRAHRGQTRQSVTTHRELTRQNVWVPRTRVTRHTLVRAPGAQGGCSHAHKTAWGRECGAWANPRPYPLGRPQRKLREESLLRGQPWRPDPLQRMLLNLGLGGKSPWACKPSGQKGFFFFFSGQLMLKKHQAGTSLVVQWLQLAAPNTGGLGLIPGRGTRSHVSQLRVGMLQLRPGAARRIFFF